MVAPVEHCTARSGSELLHYSIQDVGTLGPCPPAFSAKAATYRTNPLVGKRTVSHADIDRNLKRAQQQREVR
jgi:hypothetical protein